MKLTHFSLFTGIGGIDLAGEWAGFETVGQVEMEEYQNKVLKKNFGALPRWRDIRNVTTESFKDRTGLRTVTLISGGFPCQPFSIAGRRKGKEDDRYLWDEMLRVIQELKPTWVIGENVAGILTMEQPPTISELENDEIGSTTEEMVLEEICQSLEKIGYEVQSVVIPACAVQAPHRRDRVFIVAHTRCQHGQRNEFKGESTREITGEASTKFEQSCSSSKVQTSSNANCCRYLHRQAEKHATETRKHAQCELKSSCKDVANTNKIRGRELELQRKSSKWKMLGSISEEREIIRGNWKFEPNVGRVANGISNRVDRLKCLGNAVVPQQVYPILKAIADIETNTNY
ncbi:DNA cytosine methyltransferase [Vallitalea guaymasensis]|uniref:DNA cytosine methyltransferase n=1 Tax=Vallitalea guaymasensis TaxID=1185412 RepID=UPI000DE1BD3F|nr:DNA (cytosine-5-)-methyltransferase [Vallitalea guaymasensis]